MTEPVTEPPRQVKTVDPSKLAIHLFLFLSHIFTLYAEFFIIGQIIPATIHLTLVVIQLTGPKS